MFEVLLCETPFQSTVRYITLHTTLTHARDLKCAGMGHRFVYQLPWARPRPWPTYISQVPKTPSDGIELRGLGSAAVCQIQVHLLLTHHEQASAAAARPSTDPHLPQVHAGLQISIVRERHSSGPSLLRISRTMGSSRENAPAVGMSVTTGRMSKLASRSEARTSSELLTVALSGSSAQTCKSEAVPVSDR